METQDARNAAEKGQMSMIGADIIITGDIEASVDLHIEGRVNGDVRCATLILGETSSVQGKIYADRVRVSGEVNGAVETKDLAIEATARVTGEIVYERLRVANGGVIEGRVERRAMDQQEMLPPLKLVDPEPQVPAPRIHVIE